MDEFLPHNSITRMGDWGGVVNYGNPNSMVVMFFQKPVHNKAKSTETGRPYYDDKVFVRVHPPGERLNIVEREATDADRRRWPVQWSAYQQNKPQTSEGTPIEMLFAANPSIAATLQASGVHTVEQCAELSANAIETIGMGAQHWVNEAVRYLKVANRGVKYNEMKQMLDDRDREILSLKNKLDLVMTELNKLRDLQENPVTMEAVQQMLANQGGGGRRGLYPPGKELRNKNFDAQAAQIAAVHPTADIARAKKAAPVKRARLRVDL